LAVESPQDGEVRFLLTTIKVGAAFTAVAAIGSEAYALSTWDEPNRGLLTIIASVAMATAVILALLPGRRIATSRWGDPFFIAWGAMVLAMITAACLADGGTDSPFRVLYLLALIYAATSFPYRVVLINGVITVLSFAVVASTEPGEWRISLFIGFVILAAVLIGAYQAWNRQSQSQRLMTTAEALGESETTARQRELQQQEIAAFGQRALSGAPLSRLQNNAVATVERMLDADLVAVFEFLPQESEFRLVSGAGMSEEMIGRKLPAGRRSQSGFTMMSDGPVIVEDWSTEDRFKKPELTDEVGSASGVTVLIKGRERPFGVFGIQSTQPRSYGRDEVDFLQSIANVLASAIERRQEEERARHRALHDPLTGLPNRTLFEDHLERALARQERRDTAVGVIFMDLDRFKLVNDSLGHQSGDELLRSVSSRLKQALRPGDVVARFGGDEFAVLLDEVAEERDATTVAERIAAGLLKPFLLEEREHFVTASMGIAIGGAGADPAGLIRDADAAMYRAKDRGRARYELFDEMLRLRVGDRLRIENELRAAIDRSELRVHYQPVVSLKDGRIAGAEALIRWEHPRRGLIEPEEFIEVAEEGGLIVPMGRWVLEEATRQAAMWHNANPDSAPLEISVNVSARQLSDQRLPDLVRRTMSSAGLDPTTLSLELTEGVLMEDSEIPMEALRQLKQMGIRLVLDDFGTGFSSLSYLKRLPLDSIKLDKSFAASLGSGSIDDAIVSAVVALGQNLELSVVAEGVETQEQLDVVRKLGCDYGQGFLFSPPVAAHEFDALLREGLPQL
jgi:diguanylate cyclase (GGDEF)-like protein